MKGEEKHTVFDLTSKVVDFLLITNQASGSSAPQSLLILAEEELVAIDMTDDSWPVYPAPYLNSIHASAVTCLSHVADIDDDLFLKIRASGSSRSHSHHHDPKERLSSNPWPVSGGKVESTTKTKHSLLVTGHEDGSVKIWSCGGVALSHVATVRTNKYFVGDDLDEQPGEMMH
jgi:lethal(2) giant larvae protein